MATDQVLFAQEADLLVFKFVGDIRFTLCPAVDDFMKSVFNKKSKHPILVDLTETKSIDSTALGLLAQIAIHSRKMLNQKPGLLVSDQNVLQVLKGMSLEKVFNILHETIPSSGDFQEIEPVSVDKKDMITRILMAHHTLMSLSEENREKFKNVTELLEEQAKQLDTKEK
jgi:anti-anti-sigma factor